LSPAQLPSAPDALATDGLIGINSNEREHLGYRVHLEPVPTAAA
jgi:hypothetical protein